MIVYNAKAVGNREKKKSVKREKKKKAHKKALTKQKNCGRLNKLSMRQKRTLKTKQYRQQRQ